MAEPIRTYTPRRDLREELRRKVENAPIDHAEAVLAAYALLQEAQDHGVFDLLRGSIGAGARIIGNIAECANTPEGIRLLRNVLAAAPLLGELDPEILDEAAEALSRIRRDSEGNSRRPSFARTLWRLAGIGSRRALAAGIELFESQGRSYDSKFSEAGQGFKMASGAAVPVLASTVILMAFSFWIGRRSLSR